MAGTAISIPLTFSPAHIEDVFEGTVNVTLVVLAAVEDVLSGVVLPLA